MGDAEPKTGMMENGLARVAVKHVQVRNMPVTALAQLVVIANNEGGGSGESNAIRHAAMSYLRMRSA